MAALTAALAFVPAQAPAQELEADDEPVDYVNPLAGTLSKFELSTGNTYPVIAMPWGMNFWSPQTGKMGDGWMYTYTADKIRGFKQTHQPSPWINDYGQFSLMPVTGKPVFNEDERASWFCHKAEVAKPYYYKVYLADYDVTTEITPTMRAAMFRFTFSQSDSSFVVVDAFDKGSYVKIVPEENKIVGYTTRNSGGVPSNFKNYFVIKFSKPFAYKYTVADNVLHKDVLESTCDHAEAVIGFATKKGEQVTAQVASSFISEEQAETNLKELGDNSFDEIADKGRKQWNTLLGRVEVDDDNIDHVRTFYSCLYRAMLFPRTLYEVTASNRIMHYSPYTGQVLPGYMFADTGFWDTFRSLFPLLNLLFPSVNEKMQAGLVNDYKESKFLPEWSSPGHRDCMIGQNSASVVADAYLKGLKGYDAEALWAAVTHGANAHLEHTSSGRVAFDLYNKMGYVPSDKGIGQSAARTLEYAYDDWAIYTFGKALGKSKKELEPYRRHAFNYKNVFNKEHLLMSGRDSKGKFNPDFKPEDWSNDFCEGNSWHWSFCVFHDPAGLISLMGGKDMFNRMLDSIFVLPSYLGLRSRGVIHEMREMQVMNMGQYAHGNQPIQHLVYLYNYSGEPWKTQMRVRDVMDKLYNPNPDAYCGDEDNGQTSAWYVFSALGFYPVCPGSGQYVLGTPYFDEVTLHLENGNEVSIEAHGNSADNKYVKAMQLNGNEYSKTYVNHADLEKGASIIFEMSSVPNKKRATADTDAPYSFSSTDDGK